MYGNFVHATNDASHYTKPSTEAGGLVTDTAGKDDLGVIDGVFRLVLANHSQTGRLRLGRLGSHKPVVARDGAAV